MGTKRKASISVTLPEQLLTEAMRGRVNRSERLSNLLQRGLRAERRQDTSAGGPTPSELLESFLSIQSSLEDALAAVRVNVRLLREITGNLDPTTPPHRVTPPAPPVYESILDDEPGSVYGELPRAFNEDPFAACPDPDRPGPVKLVDGKWVPVADVVDKSLPAPRPMDRPARDDKKAEDIL